MELMSALKLQGYYYLINKCYGVKRIFIAFLIVFDIKKSHVCILIRCLNKARTVYSAK